MTLVRADWEPELVTTTATKLVLTAATNRPFRVRQVMIGFNGVTTTQTPLEVRLQIASAAGTGTARALVKIDRRDGTTIGMTGLTVMTVEPTYTTILQRWYLNLQTPPFLWQPPEREFIVVGAGEILGVKVVGTPSPDVHCLGELILEE